MIDYDALPSDLPDMYLYLLSKADRYLGVGPERYRSGDTMNCPVAYLTPEELDVIRRGMEQIVEFRGYTPGNPFRDLGIAGFHELLCSLHFIVSKQILAEFREESREILDEMHMKHMIGKKEIVLYNLVQAPNRRPLEKRRRAKKGKPEA